VSAFPPALLTPRTANTASDVVAQVPKPVYSRSSADAKVHGFVPVADHSMTGDTASLSVDGATVVGRAIYAGAEWIAESHSPWPSLMTALGRLHELNHDWDGDGAPAPNAFAIYAARTVLERAFERGLTAAVVLPSVEGGVFVAFDGDGARRANIECFNNGTAYGATVADTVAVWPVSTVDRSSIEAALQRISEHVASS